MAYATVILADSPVAYWRLGEATPGTGTAVDETGGHDGTYVASPTSAPGGLMYDADTAVLFNGTTQRVDVPDSAGINFGNAPYSIELWARRVAFPAALSFMLYRGTNSYAVGFSNVTTKFWTSKAGVAQMAQETGTTTDSNWHHWVVTRVGSASGETLIYKDGVEGTTFLSVQTVANPSATSLTLASLGSTGSQLYGGDLDEVALYSAVLTAAQVLTHYRVGRQLLHRNPMPPLIAQ